MKTIVITPDLKKKLNSYIERLVEMNKEKTILLADIQNIYKQAGDEDIDVKALRNVVQVILKQKTREEVEEEALVFEEYLENIEVSKY